MAHEFRYIILNKEPLSSGRRVLGCYIEQEAVFQWHTSSGILY